MVLGLCLPFLGTAVGSLAALGLPVGSRRWSAALAGAAGGAMLAACVWGLLLPGLSQNGSMAASGFALGLLGLLIPERLPRGRLSPGAVLILAVILHNIPEGMAVGAGRAGGASAGLTLSIALQNIPDGAVVAAPLAAMGMRRGKAFLAGVLSGAVEPVAALVMMLCAPVLSNWLPAFMGFAAGAMLYVVLQELTPRMTQSGWGTVCFAAGFLLMY